MSEGKQAEILEFIRSLESANDSIDVNTDLISSGVLDSLSVMELVAFLSEKFGVTIPAGDVTPVNLRTVVTLSALVEARSV